MKPYTGSKVNFEFIFSHIIDLVPNLCFMAQLVRASRTKVMI